MESVVGLLSLLPFSLEEEKGVQGCLHIVDFERQRKSYFDSCLRSLKVRDVSLTEVPRAVWVNERCSHSSSSKKNVLKQVNAQSQGDQ